MKTSLFVFTLICLVAFTLGVIEARQHLGREWQPVAAEFVCYETKYRSSAKRAARPVLHYTYRVNDQSYSGTDRSLTGRRYANGEEAEAAVWAKHDRERLTAFYDISHPAVSDLNPIHRATAWSYIYAPVIVLLAGHFFAFLGSRIDLGK